MGTFNSSKIFYASPDLIGRISEDLADQMESEGYQVSKQKLLTGGYDISLTKGDTFKAVIGMKTALKVLIRPNHDKISVDASVGIFGQQAIPTAISMLLFWPVLIPQIWGLIQQSKLDDKIMEIIERSIQAAESKMFSSVSSAPGKSIFCTSCGNKVSSKARFCSNCGASLK